MNADVTSEPLYEIFNKAIDSNPDMKLTNSTVDSSQKLHTVEEDMINVGPRLYLYLRLPCG
jgi:hypothetical protein